MKRLLALFILLQSCNDYEVLPDGRKYTLKDTCLRSTIVTYNYTTYIVIGNQSYQQINVGTRYICLENIIDTIFINE